MSADGPRKGGIRLPENVVRPQPVTERTLMESVAGLINEVGLTAQQYNATDEAKHKVLWTKIDSQPGDLRNGAEVIRGAATSQEQRSLLVTLGYATGIQMWMIPVTGEAQEVMSWKRPGVKTMHVLPSPEDVESDEFAAQRPAVLLHEVGTGGTGSHNLIFVSLRTGEVLKTLKYNHAIHDVRANATAIVVSFLDKVLVIDPSKFEVTVTIKASDVAGRMVYGIPIALGPTWLAFGDRRLHPSLQSAGGMESASAPSYTATMIHAAKSLTKGLKGLGETVANSFAGHRPPVNPDATATTTEPGVVTVVNLKELQSGEYCLDDMACVNNGNSNPAVIAHFVAHESQPVYALRFDPSGMLLVTADKTGHDFNVFRLHPHPLGSSMAAAHHLYVLHRGDTGAKVQDISFAPDSRWVAISTFRGTTHIFPITPYGGAVSIRTHSGPRIVNKLSRFQRTAGLDEVTPGRQSPVSTPLNFIGFGNKSFDMLFVGSPYPNYRYPPYPHPTVVLPLAQLRQSYMAISAPSLTSPTTNKGPGGGLLPSDERVYVSALFSETRGWFLSSPTVLASCDKRKKPFVESLFVLTSYGTLIEYSLEPIPTSNIPKEKITDDASIDLSVHATAQWTFTKPSTARDLQPPFPPNSVVLSASSVPNSNGKCDNVETDGSEDNTNDEHWLSQVEITTHSAPCRKLWMGPQITFKVFNTANSKALGTGPVDIETVEVSVTNRPAKSKPVKMPTSSALIPEISSSEDSSDPSPSSACNINLENLSISHDSQIKENLAEAMLENGGMKPSKGSSSSGVTGSCEDDFSSSSVESDGAKIPDGLVPEFSIESSFPD